MARTDTLAHRTWDWDQEPQHRYGGLCHTAYGIRCAPLVVSLSKIYRPPVVPNRAENAAKHAVYTRCPDNEALPSRYRCPESFIAEFIFPRVEQKGGPLSYRRKLHVRALSSRGSSQVT